jgi:DNA topoisomerase-1
VRDRRIARIVRSCQELPGQQLFQYLDETGRRQTVASSDVNAYLKAVSGVDITAKDFRTWSGTVLAAMALAEFETTDQQARAKAAVTRAVARVSARLGNTPAICRKCYIHPEIISAYLDGALLLGIQSHIDGPLSRAPESLRPEEAAVLMFLRTRVARDLEAADAKTTPPISGRRPATRSTGRSRPHPAEAVDRRNGPARASRM